MFLSFYGEPLFALLYTGFFERTVAEYCDLLGILMASTTDEAKFNVEEAKVLVTETIENNLGGVVYNPTKIKSLTNGVVEKIVTQLTRLNKPFKYIVTCLIMQKSGAGLNSASSCYWDDSSDGVCNVRWDNKTLYCMVSVYGLAI
ncbi:unnamed protein product [Notodromas monacha]|uniref:Dynein light chain Tctex-type 1 n=1 Tax=Notodromas monacha TaxID=399045 RepID=A0A7R9G939_9CRUS|nr:unnamed protein product [Notodromas monacha]CAG0912753.1 unnamed protein product [Notodromas monacha]